MDFSDALKALKAGKKVRRKLMQDGYYLEIGYHVANDPIIYIKQCGSDSKAMFSIIQAHVLANDWEIFEPKIVSVKTKTVEYITCSNCGKDIEVEKTWDAVRCKHCNSIMEIEIPMTVEDAIAIFKEKYYSDIGELTSINFPCLRTDKGVQHGTIKVVSIDPFRTILEKKYSP